MDPKVLALFHELADRSPSEREDYYAQKQVLPAVRAEVESLLRFDGTTTASLRQYVAAAAEGALLEGDRAGRQANMSGRVIGQYRVVEKIGEGGMGVVYRAEDLTLHRSVAIKVISDRFNDSADARARFLREARSVAALNHPNICTIHEVLEIDGEPDSAGAKPDAKRPLIVLELVEGETLQNLVSRSGRLDVGDLLSIATQVADALAEAHRRRIIHRDLKPGNIMVTAAGRVKILDFGLAKALAALPATGAETTGVIDGGGPLAQPSTLAGTIAYMSPEQAEGLPLDSRSDMFSFGTVLYEMACGRRPFEADTQAEIVAKILNADPPSILEFRDDLPAALDEIVRRCLQKRADDRYQDTQDLLSDLRAVQRTPSLLLAPGRSSGLWTAALAFLLVIGLAAVVQLTRALRPRAPGETPAPIHRQITFVGDASYPVVSPDGTMVAYVRGDPWGEVSSTVAPRNKQTLVIQELGTGDTLAIGQCVFCRDPKWAPDGSALLVVDQAGILLFSRIGGERRRYDVRGVHLAWSPDGRGFATAPLSSSAITIVDRDTGTRTELPLKAPTIGLRDLEWAPTGHWIAAVTRDEQSRSTMWVVSRDGKAQEEVLRGELDVSGIRWSDRGDAIYFLRRRAQVRELWKIHVSPETGRAVRPATLVLGGLQAGPNFAVSNDGRKLFYTREIRYSNLWVAPVERLSAGGAAAGRQISFGTLSDNFPAVSPDGGQIAFVRNDGRASNIFVVPFKGGTARQLTFLDSAHGAPAWSPNGRTLAFCALHDGEMKVWTIPAVGDAPRAYPATKCTTGMSETPIAWIQPDRVLYQRTGNRNYHQLDLASGSETPLVQNEKVGWVFAPRLSPDKTQLAVYWNQPSIGRGLFVMPWPVQETMARFLLFAAWPMGWSSDGRSIFAYDMKGSSVWTVRVDRPARVMLRDLSDRRIALVPAITPDGKHVVFSAHAIHSDVWVTEDFDPVGR